MAKVEIYTTSYCPFCYTAKNLLDSKNVDFKEIDASDPDVRSKMTKRAGGRHTVPQVFIDNDHIGGCDDLVALDKSGALDTMI